MDSLKIPGAYCCEIDCKAEATWQIQFGRQYDDYTHSCDEHLAFLTRNSLPCNGMTSWDIRPIDARR